MKKVKTVAPLKPKATKEKKPKIVKPEPIEAKTIIIPHVKEKVETFFAMPKMKVLTTVPIPEGFVRCRVLKAHDGIKDFHNVGDIIDIPERRYKSLSFRGVVELYNGELQPNKRR